MDTRPLLRQKSSTQLNFELLGGALSDKHAQTPALLRDAVLNQYRPLESHPLKLTGRDIGESAGISDLSHSKQSSSAAHHRWHPA
jgi:hypothetical protein